MVEINIKRILLESIGFLKNNFLKLLPFVIGLFIYSMISVIFSYIPTQKNIDPLVLSLVTSSYGILTMVLLVVFIKLTMAIQISINSILLGQVVKFGSAYKMTKGKVWLYIRCTLMISLWLIPYFAIVIAKVPFAIAIGSLYISFILANYFMLIPLIALEEKTNKYLTRAKDLIKGNYLKMWCLILVTITIFSFPYAILSFIFLGQATRMFILGIIYALNGFFTIPFLSIVTVITYRKLIDNTKMLGTQL